MARGRRNRRVSEFVFMSIKPVFGEEILDGVKKFELRSKVGTLLPGDKVILYESYPVKSVVGMFSVGRTFVVDFPVLLELFRSGVLEGVTERDIEFMSSRKRPILVIEVVDPIRLPQPITLSELRVLVPGFRPPMSFSRLPIDSPIVREVLRRLRRSSKRS